MEYVIAATISSVIASAADSEAVSEPPFIAARYLEVSSFAASFAVSYTHLDVYKRQVTNRVRA